MKIDVHVHLYGRGDGGTGCFIRGRFNTSVLIPFLKFYHRIRESDLHSNLDSTYLTMILRDFLGSPSIDGIVLLAHDRIYREDGSEDARTGLYTPNDYVLSIVRHQREFLEEIGLRAKDAGANAPTGTSQGNENAKTGLAQKRIFAGISVHPHRKDAIDELVRCKDQGASLVKLLPDSQNFDPQDRKHTEYFETLAKLGLPMLAHTGGEHILKTLDKRYRDPGRLKPALDCGATVVAAHCGLKTGMFDRDYYSTFSSMVRQYPNLYGDTAGFIIPTRWRRLRVLLKDAGTMKKLIHGSDIPVPCVPVSVAGILTIEEVRRISKIANLFERDYQTKKAMGFPDEVFTRLSTLIT